MILRPTALLASLLSRNARRFSSFGLFSPSAFLAGHGLLGTDVVVVDAFGTVVVVAPMVVVVLSEDTVVVVVVAPGVEVVVDGMAEVVVDELVLGSVVVLLGSTLDVVVLGSTDVVVVLDATDVVLVVNSVVVVVDTLVVVEVETDNTLCVLLPAVSYV